MYAFCFEIKCPVAGPPFPEAEPLQTVKFLFAVEGGNDIFEVKLIADGGSK
jgi:hypothetical protein